MEFLKWTEVRQLLIARFGPAISNPLVEPQHLRLRPNETVQNYYDDKMRAFRRVTLAEQDIVAQLTEGMPSTYRGYLLCARLTSSVAWLAVALQLEVTLRRQTLFPPKPTQQFKSQSRAIALAVNQPKRSFNQNRNRDIPPTPCRFCTEAGETL